MIIDFHKCYGGGGSGSGVTPQEVQAQIDSALTPYWNSAATESAITQSVSGKADAQNVTPESQGFSFPEWNNQGVITGHGETVREQLGSFNGNNFNFAQFSDNGSMNFYAPTSHGTAGEVLVSSGPGNAPVWSAVTGPDMSGYYTSAQTDEKIASAVTPVANHLAEVEEITASAYTELHDDILALSARTPDMSAYTPTSGFSTINGSAITNGGNIVIQGGGGDMSAYWNSAQTKSYVDSAATNLQDQIDTMDEVVSDALNDLNGQLVTKVSSSSVSTIWKGTQAEYDLIVSKDPATFYIIVSSN